MNRAASHPLATFDEIVRYADLESGRIGLSERQTDLNELLSAIVHPLAEKGRHASIDLSFEIAPEVPRHVLTDPVRLAQVITGLVDLCMESMSGGSLLVRCCPLASEPGRTYLHFAVSDTTVALDPAFHARAKRVFTQSRFALRDLDDLPLAIPRMIVQLMNGVIWMDTLPEAGNVINCAVWVRTRSSRGTPDHSSRPRTEEIHPAFE